MSDTAWTRTAGHITVTVDTDGYMVINHRHGAVAVLDPAELITAIQAGTWFQDAQTEVNRQHTTGED